LGDITGKGKGAGKGAARAVGAGEDEAFERAARAEVDVARSAWIADLIGEEKDLGRALLLLAGGREFLEGKGARIGGAGVAWRAAIASLRHDAAEGAAGRQAGEHFSGVSLALEAGQLESQRASLEAWARGERILEDTADATARRALSSWVWRPLVPGRAPGANAAREREGARRRAKFLIRLVHGNSWADAARLAGFADGGAASKSLANTETWAALARAQVAESGVHPLAAGLRRAWWRPARAEVKARRAARVWLRTTAARGAVRKVARGLPVVGGAVLVQRGGARRIARTTAGRVVTFLDGGSAPVFAQDRAPRVSRKVRRLAVNIPAAAARAIAAREQAARLTSGAAARLLAFRERAARSWEQASKGLRRGFMQ